MDIFGAIENHRAAARQACLNNSLRNAEQHYRSILTLCAVVRDDLRNSGQDFIYRTARTEAADFIMQQEARDEQLTTLLDNCPPFSVLKIPHSDWREFAVSVMNSRDLTVDGMERLHESLKQIGALLYKSSIKE